jgi:hypothetical protein
VCTVSVVPHDVGCRIVCNRDERRSRSTASPPTIYSVGRQRAVFPVDASSGGTWIAANDAGLVLALLNRSAGAVSQGDVAFRSRGHIVPALTRHSTLTSAIDAALALPPLEFQPFQIIGVQGSEFAILTSNRRRITIVADSLHEPILCTSSSLGDTVVEGPRGALFQRLVRATPQERWRHGQYRFHRHWWTAKPELSVLMSRPDARTVSRTTVDVSGRVVMMRYEPLDDSSSLVPTDLEGAA